MRSRQGSRSQRRCRHHGEHVVKRGAEAEVVARGQYRYGVIDGHRAYLCRYRDKRRMRLGADGDLLTIRTMRINGPFVAFEDAFSDGGPDDSTTLILRTFTGAKHKYVIDDGAATSTTHTYRGIELNSKGSVGFIRVGNTGPAGVFRCQPVGCPKPRVLRAEMLDGFTGLKLDSLRRTRRGFSWMRNGKRKFATLC